jgi:GTPase
MSEQQQHHRSGFVNILGKPNVGKSTLMNALVGERLSIITSKAQTTRHRIFGIINGDGYQVVFSDTPGIIKPHYKMQEKMMGFVRESLEDADIILFLVEIQDSPENQPEEFGWLKDTETPVLLVLNKIDLFAQKDWKDMAALWQNALPNAKIILVSAGNKLYTQELLDLIVTMLPEGEPYYDKEALTDKPERFFVSEIIREKILMNYKQEIPYSCEVRVETFKEETHIIRIAATIYVDRASQKPIVIGKGGAKLKTVGTQARIDMEAFFGKKVFLELFVKVSEGWRDDERQLDRFGYQQ